MTAGVATLALLTLHVLLLVGDQYVDLSLTGVLVRRNLLVVYMCLELMLAAATLAKAAQACHQEATVLQWLQDFYQQQPSLDVLEAMVSLGTVGSDARQPFLQHLQKHPSLLAASRWLAGASSQEAVPPAVQKALDTAARPLARYRCAACGFEAKEHFWHCPGCQAWDSYPPRRVEEL